MKLKSYGHHMRYFLICVFAVLSLGCTTSVIMPKYEQYASAKGNADAVVYIMRPTLQRTRGVADNDLVIEFIEDQPAALLSAGEYVAFRVKAGSLDIITRNETYLEARPEPEMVWRSRNFVFEAGGTYFIEAKLTQEEFRGVYFIAKEIDLKTAKSFLNRIKAAGDLAKSQPVSSL